jgi:hypothetical protein
MGVRTHHSSVGYSRSPAIPRQPHATPVPVVPASSLIQASFFLSSAALVFSYAQLADRATASAAGHVDGGSRRNAAGGYWEQTA